VAGWTKTVRPATSYTNRLKAEQMRDFELAGSMQDYDEDQLVPLCIGGPDRSAQPMAAPGDREVVNEGDTHTVAITEATSLRSRCIITAHPLRAPK
jgi:hypothetical protein